MPVPAGDVEQVEGAAKITVRVFKNITLVHEAGMVLLEVCKRAAVAVAARVAESGPTECPNGGANQPTLCVCVLSGRPTL